MATKVKETQCPKQYPHKKSSPIRELFPFSHSRVDLNNFVSATVNAIEAVTIDKRIICFILEE